MALRSGNGVDSLIAFLAAVVLTAAFSLAAFMNWRRGLFLMIFMAAIQDPIRKLVPGTPGYLVLITAPILLVATLRALAGVPRWWRDFKREFPAIARSIVALMVMCIPAAVISLTYGPGSWMATLLGVFSYSTILLAILAGFHFSRKGITFRQLIATYVVIHGFAMTGAIIEYFALLPDWIVISDTALGYNWVRYGDGYIVEFIAGFYRSGDVMGWHAAAVTCLSLTLMLTGFGRGRYIWIVFAVLGIFALLVCGRRKMVYIVPVYLSVLVMLYWWAGRRELVIKALLVLSLPTAIGLMFVDIMAEETTFIRYYTETSDQAVDSLAGHGFGSVISTVQQSGMFGNGLGFATPGAHHLPIARPRIWQESGTSRLFVELGVPGAIAFIVLVFQIARALFTTTMGHLTAKTPYAALSAGLLSYFVANIASLTVSGQILADPFVAAWLGILVGLVLGSKRLPKDPTIDRVEAKRQEMRRLAAELGVRL